MGYRLAQGKMILRIKDLVPEHFAYRLEGAAFGRLQFGAWKEVNRPVTQYKFVTGWASLEFSGLAVRHLPSREAGRPGPKN